MGNSFDPLVLEFAPWSYSKASMAKRCPFSFCRQYIDKIPVPFVQNEAAKIGTLVHSILEEALKRAIPVKDAYQRVCIAQNELTDVEMQKCLQFRHGVQDFLDRINRYLYGGTDTPDPTVYSKEELIAKGYKYDPSHPNAVEGFVPKILNGTKCSKKYIEEKIAINADFTPGQYWGRGDKAPFFRGVIDYGFITDSERRMAIFDHKTSSVATKEYYYDQMLVYEVLAYFGTGEVINTIQTHLHFVGPKEILRYDPVDAHEIRSTRKQKFIEFMNSCVSEIKSEKAITGKHCEWCTFHSICPAQKK